MMAIGVAKVVCSYIALFFLSAGMLMAQESREEYGDASVKASIAPLTRVIYSMEGDWVFMLSCDSSLASRGTFATELQGKFVGNHIRQSIATEWRQAGKYSAEYFFDENNLIYVYETFEYYEEASPVDAWRNFKGLAAWERRSYFQNGRIEYAEVLGAGDVAPGSNALPLLEAAHRLRMVLEKRRLEQ